MTAQPGIHRCHLWRQQLSLQPPVRPEPGSAGTALGLDVSQQGHRGARGGSERCHNLVTDPPGSPPKKTTKNFTKFPIFAIPLLPAAAQPQLFPPSSFSKWDQHPHNPPAPSCSQRTPKISFYLPSLAGAAPWETPGRRCPPWGGDKGTLPGLPLSPMINSSSG